MPEGSIRHDRSDRSDSTSSARRRQRGSPDRAAPAPRDARDADVRFYVSSRDPRRPDETKLREIARRLGVSRETLEQYLSCRDAGFGRDS